MSVMHARDVFATRRRQIRTRRSFISMGATQGTGAIVAQNASTFTSKALSLYRPLQEEQRFLMGKIKQSLPTRRTPLADQAVELAWRFERAVLELGGKGTREWTIDQVNEILAYGKPSNHTGFVSDRFEGHHINNVANNPLQQGDPDNISFLTRKEHLDAHSGDWHTSTSGRIHNRSYLIKERAIYSELLGLGIMVGIGFGIGVAFSLLNKSAGIGEHLLHGIDGAAMSGLSHVGGRLAAHLLLKASLYEAIGLAGVGVAGSIVAALYTFAKLKHVGVRTSEALGVAGAQFGVSLVGVFITTIAKLLWGTAGALWAALAFAALVFVYSLLQAQEAKRTIRKLKIHEITLLQPAI
jgi:hypothetical protein